VKAATDKAEAEADKINCFKDCPEKSVEVVFSKWCCQGGPTQQDPNRKPLPLAIVQAVRRCKVSE
jgi:hypothetical protein